MTVGFTAKEIAYTTVHASTVCPEYAFRIEPTAQMSLIDMVPARRIVLICRLLLT